MAYGDLVVNDSLVLVEGAPNAPVEMAMGYDEFGVQQRMRTIRLTDVALDLNPHNIMGVAAERLAFNALAVVDWLIATTVGASTLNLKFPVGRANRAAITTADKLTALEVRNAVAALKKRNIAPFSDGFYRAMVDPNVVVDLMADTSVGGWIEASKYASPENLLNGELGRLYGVRFIESNTGLWITNTGGVGSAVPIYRSVFYGPEYFVFGDLQSTRSYMVRPGNDHADPAAQAALLSWKGMYGAMVLGNASTTAVGAGYKHLILEHAGSLAGA
jgi:N4-gp56 family major capsid protein